MVCINPIYIRKTGITVRCGKCKPCLEQRQKEWAVRLSLELKNSFTAYFVTLTFDDESIKKYPKLDKSQFQRFLKRLRQYDLRGMPTTYEGKKVFKIASKGQNFKYFAVGEYGTLNNRPHWHMLLFNFPYDHEMAEIIISHSWGEDYKSLGFCHVGLLKGGSIEYVTDYLFKNIEGDSQRYMSKGIGGCYVNSNITNYHQKTLDGLIHINGRKLKMPRYVRNKVYNQDQRKSIGEKNIDFIIDKALDDPLSVQRDLIKLENKIEFRKSKKLLK